MTVKLVVVAVVTVACVAPKKTMLLAGVELKFVPVIVTDVPIGPLVGVKLVMVGTCAALKVTIAKLNTSSVYSFFIKLIRLNRSWQIIFTSWWRFGSTRENSNNPTHNNHWHNDE